jgi:hypothetical protein
LNFRRLFFFCIIIISILFSTLGFSQIKYGHEWIESGLNYFKIKVNSKGIYKIDQTYMLASGLNFKDLDWSKIELRHHGLLVPLESVGLADGKWDSADYILFFGLANQGELDSLLYRPYSARMNPYHSLYTDDANYYLGVGKKGKNLGTESPKPFDQAKVVSFHMEEKIQAFNEQYSFNNSIGLPPYVMQSYFEKGEGWTGRIIVADSLAKIKIPLSGFQADSGIKPELECLYNGRTELKHEVSISIAKTNLTEAREIGKIDGMGFETSFIKTTIEADEINSKQEVELRSQSALKDKTEWHSITYYKLKYPQKLSMNAEATKSFFLNFGPYQSKSIAITDLKQKTGVFQIKNRYQFKRLLQASVDLDFKAAIDSTTHYPELYLSSELKKPKGIEQIKLPELSLKENTFLILSHPKLFSSASAYASYRASAAGGAYPTHVINILDLYELYTFGERTPLAIKRFLEHQLSLNKKINNLLIIGRGVSFPDRLKDQEATDLVPTMGYPGSDILLSAGIGGFHEDLHAIPTGRISVETDAQVLAYLQKVKEYEADQNDLIWRKRILHLSGGLNVAEIQNFKDILNQYSPKIEKSLLSGRLKAINKTQDIPVQNIDISAEINQGSGFVTFLGHSSSSSLDFNIGPASNPNNRLQNSPRYPLMYFNGCGAGNVFNRYDVLSTDWLLTPSKGAIAIWANSFWSYDFSTIRYINELYTQLFEDSNTAGKSIGEAQQATNKKIIQEGTEKYILSNIHQLLLQGDPSIKVFPLQNPDYYVTKAFVLSDIPSKNIGQSDSVNLGLVLSNSGRYVANSNLDLKINNMYFRTPALGFSDTLYFKIKKNNTENKLVIDLDPDQKIIENLESNNRFELKVDWSEANLSSSYPLGSVPDLTAPLLDVYFDKKQIRPLENVYKAARVDLILQDENPLSLQNKKLIQVFLRKICETCTFQEISSLETNQKPGDLNKLSANFSLGNLDAGNYELLVKAQDAALNYTNQDYKIPFRILAEPEPSSMLILPNPIDAECTVAYTIKDIIPPKTAELMLFDASGRKIHEQVLNPKLGENSLSILPFFQSGHYIIHLKIIKGDGKVDILKSKLIKK